MMGKVSRLQDSDYPVNPELVRERKNCNFSQEEFTNILDGGPEETQKRRQVEDIYLTATGIVDNETVLESLSSVERYGYDIKKSVELFKLARESMGEDGDINGIRSMLGAGIGSIASPDGNPLGLHFVMFLPTIMGQGTMEQQSEWLSRAWDMEIIGTYAQTEMGHGTFIRGLETTATYDPNAEEFILHTPSISAYKWWPGGLGKTANYAVVMAQLVTRGQKYGPHAFIVQLRDEQSHKPLPGVTVGEIGPKLGMNSNDNGYLGFDHYRIPRKNMLMRNAKVEKDGTYVKPPQDKLSYGTMVFVRCAIVMDASSHLRKAVTIATRYSAVRRQVVKSKCIFVAYISKVHKHPKSELRPGEPEPQIIEYQTQQYKLFPALAMSIGFTFASQKLMGHYEESLQAIDGGDYEMLPELHSLSCGLKALVTQESADVIDVLRRSCGGHGFMSSSNLPRIWALVTASCTYEGENTVMQLQVARYLIKSIGNPNVALKQSVQYLKKSSSQFRPFQIEELLSHVDLFARVAKGQVHEAYEKLKALESEGMDKADCWNNSTIELSQAAMAHTRYLVMQEFLLTLHDTQMSETIQQILTSLFQLLSIFWILKHSGDFFEHGNIKMDEKRLLVSKMKAIFAFIRPIAVPLVDAFDFHDASLKSTLGSYDGRIYERLFEAAKRSQLNKKDVHESHFKYIKMLTNGSKL